MPEHCANNYLDHLVDSLEFLIRDNRINSNPQFANNYFELSTLLGNLRSNKKKGHKRWEANFKLLIPLDDIEMCGPMGETLLFVGADIICDDQARIRQSIGAWLIYNPVDSVDANNSNGMYPLNSDEYAVCRKFHFDYDRTLEDSDECHWPWAHLQYGGDCKKALLPFEQEKIRYDLFSAIDFPRIPFPPYDFNLTFDLFCKQFRSSLSDITEESGWVKIIKKSEQIWLEKYYHKINEYFEMTRPETLYEYSRKIDPLA